MPDWSYHTSIKYALNTLPDKSRDKIVLNSLNLLGSHQIGKRIIRFMGHMEPNENLEYNFFNNRLKSPIALGRSVDPSGKAKRAFQEFGISYQEVSYSKVNSPKTYKLSNDPPCLIVVDQIKELHELKDYSGPVRLGTEFSLMCLNNRTELNRNECIISLPTNYLNSSDQLDDDIDFLKKNMIHWIQITWSKNFDREGTILLIEKLAKEGFSLILASDVLCPQDAKEFKDLGIKHFVLNEALRLSGPGLPKRLNNSLAAPLNNRRESLRPTKSSWFYGLALGVAMGIGGIMAWLIAHHKVLLPYDEVNSQLNLDQIKILNEKILHFLVHDRVTLAGTMIAIGILYSSFAWFSIRRGEKWAKEAICFSALFGFLNFFAFLFYDYFDVFHAFVTACLLQIFLLCVYADLPPVQKINRPSSRNDSIWKMSLWSQALFVTQGLGLILAGLVITYFGATQVFVPQDLDYLGQPADLIRSFHRNLVPLIAHDRCTFGGMLGASGICILMSALHGFERGRSWLWWVYIFSGFPPYLITIRVHVDIGYIDQFHLAPVYIGIALLIGGLILGAPYLLDKKHPQAE